MITELKSANCRKARDLSAEILDDFALKEPPVNPVLIARGEGVKVNFVTFGENHREKISGFYDPDEHSIYVNSDEHPLRQTFTIAHELGHALLHREWASSENYKIMLRGRQDVPGANPYEQEANDFAANLLVPRFMLDKYVDILNVAELSRLFAVSLPTIKFRLANEYDLR